MEEPTKEINDIISYFKNNKIIIQKLNHCMTLSGPTQFDSFMQLDSEGNFM